MKADLKKKNSRGHVVQLQSIWPTFVHDIHSAFNLAQVDVWGVKPAIRVQIPV